jgi:carboxylesterase type B
MSMSVYRPILTSAKLVNNMENKTSTAASAPAESCLVQTTIGQVEGFVDPSFPRVRQWLGVPFAEPPTGQRRFAPPIPKAALPTGETLSATKMPPAPMQSYTSLPNMYSKYVPEYMANSPYSEDCLYLNVFAPQRGTTEPLPTLVFFYGGQGEWGGINSEYMQPHAWVERSQNHIVVLFKCVSS